LFKFKKRTKKEKITGQILSAASWPGLSLFCYYTGSDFNSIANHSANFQVPQW